MKGTIYGVYGVIALLTLAATVGLGSSATVNHVGLGITQGADVDPSIEEDSVQVIITTDAATGIEGGLPEDPDPKTHVTFAADVIDEEKEKDKIIGNLSTKANVTGKSGDTSEKAVLDGRASTDIVGAEDGSPRVQNIDVEGNIDGRSEADVASYIDVDVNALIAQIVHGTLDAGGAGGEVQIDKIEDALASFIEENGKATGATDETVSSEINIPDTLPIDLIDTSTPDTAGGSAPADKDTTDSIAEDLGVIESEAAGAGTTDASQSTGAPDDAGMGTADAADPGQ